MKIDRLLGDATYSMETLYEKQIEALKKGLVFKVILSDPLKTMPYDKIRTLIALNFVFLKEYDNKIVDSRFFQQQYSLLKYNRILFGLNNELECFISDSLIPNFSIKTFKREGSFFDMGSLTSFDQDLSPEQINTINENKCFYITLKSNDFLNFNSDHDILMNNIIKTFEPRVNKRILEIQSSLSPHSLKEINKLMDLQNKNNYGFKDAFELYWFLHNLRWKFESNKTESSHWFTLKNILNSSKSMTKLINSISYDCEVFKSYYMKFNKKHKQYQISLIKG